MTAITENHLLSQVVQAVASEVNLIKNYIEKYLVIHKDDIIRALEIVAEMNNLYVILAFEHEMSKILYVVCTIIFIRFAI